ncbi:hypothetical protein [Paracoccus sulfuroxidans]|uniref:Uncharacterized protein n=1 Tax=Paracoccus sulfuroxidans TaxID=384678 RepID=A0A562NQI9_9RHOB|nr:hypothetical protein [Paracoccus sulfuroxidans]AZV00346.1 hypothetical protein psul1_p38 [Paracoccus phage vB_PsuS_Psul1]TWI34301.1 hypothetical protein IQ24_01816 [Paracoccus sulfuroxidans]
MALIEPYPLAFLSDILTPVGSITFDLVRFEENSGTGSGQHWAAQLASPLWKLSLPLQPRDWRQAREINARIFALGSNRSFLFCDNSYRPANGQAAGGVVKVGVIGADRRTLSLTGLPPNFRVISGDRLSIGHSGGRQYFGQFVETMTASGAGALGQVSIEPPLPMPVTASMAVVLDRPVIRLRVPQGSFTPFTDTPGYLSSGASLTPVQKL